jgi:hypothetical protein
MCGISCHRGGSDGRKALVPESRGAGTGVSIIVDWPRKAPAGRDRRGFPAIRTIERPPVKQSSKDRPD